MISILRLISGDNLQARSIRGAFMTGISFGGSNAIRLAGNLILTRILFPEAFGLMALVQVVMTGLSMFSDVGLRPAIVQNQRGNDPAFLNTAWLIQIGRGIVLWLATWILAAPVAEFYAEPILAQMLPVAGLTALFQGFNSTKMATANREIRFGRLIVLKLLSQIAGLCAMVLLALWTGSVWALVLGGLAAPFLEAVLSHLVLPGHPNRLSFEATAFRQLMGFGKYIFLGTIAGFMISQADRAILGKYVSLEDLAIYNIGFFLAVVPVMLLRGLISNILFPLYARRPPGENARNRANVARARFLVILCTIGFSTVLAVLGNFLIVVLYDPRYHLAGPLLVLIAIAHLPEIISASYPGVILASGHSGRFAAQITVSACLKVVTMLVGVHWYGLVGVALAPLVAGILYYPVLVWFLRPYDSWMPRQDAGFAILGLGVAALALWTNAEALTGAWNEYMQR